MQWTVLLALVMGAPAVARPRFVPFGIDFSPYTNARNPAPDGPGIPPSEVFDRLKELAGGSVWIRTYGITHGLETSGALAHQIGFKAALEAWLGPETDSAGAGLARNRQEIASLIAAANRGEADLLVVGSEVLQRGDLPAPTLLGYMQQVRSAVNKKIPVTTDETYGALRANPTVIAGSDIVLANFYPFWGGVRIDGAIASLDHEYRQLAAAAGAKEVWVGETGWPSGGDAIGSAAPNPNNAAYYFRAFNSWAQFNHIKAFYFEAYDEGWKAESEGQRGAHWGIRDRVGTLKEGMRSVYEGYTLPASVFMRTAAVSALPGSPGIQFTKIPPFGSPNGIAGVVAGVRPSDFQVATYVKVNGGWWTKPLSNDPTVPIGPDGAFTCQTVSGGNDAVATEYALFVIPSNYTPPVALGSATIPAEIRSHSAASSDAPRPAGYPGRVALPPVATIESLSITRNFGAGKAATDTLAVTGTIPLGPAELIGASVTVRVGSASWQLGPIAKSGRAVVGSGSGKSSSGSITFTSGKTSRTFSAKLARAAGSADWNAEGLVNATILAPGIPVFLPVTINAGGQSYGAITAGYYTAQEGRRGAMEGSAAALGGGP